MVTAITTMASKPTTAMIKALKAARFHGYLRVREGKIYAGGTDELICTPATVHALVQRGWLRPWRAKYEITREGKRVEWEL